MSDGWGPARQRSVTYYDPIAAARAGAELEGIEHLRAIRDGVIPPAPIAMLFGFAIRTVEPGLVEFTCTPDESAYNPIGVVHGGLVCTLLDSVVGCAVQSMLPAGTGYTSVEIKVNYLRAVRAESGELLGRGTVTKPGRRIAFAEGTVTDGSGALVATASSTCLVFAR